MPSELKTLRLPQLVEAKRAEESRESSEPKDAREGWAPASVQDVEASPHLSASFHTFASTSDVSTPLTPSFSIRGGPRYSSSNSSLDLTNQISVPSKPSPSSPATDTLELSSSFRPKAALPDVQEEPLEREDSFDMVNDTSEVDTSFSSGLVSQRMSQDEGRQPSPAVMPLSPGYDLSDDYFGSVDPSYSPWAKQRRSDEQSLSGLTSRLHKRFPSLSRRWRGRKVSNASITESVRDGAPSRTASSRASSVNRSAHDVNERLHLESALPPTPPTSLPDDENTLAPSAAARRSPGGSESRNVDGEGQSTTPLLPPLVIPETSNKTKPTPVQSPLQSPAVAQPSEPNSVVASPIGSIYTPQFGLTSPPLSTKPSLSSIHQGINGQLVPASEIPGIKLADPNDEWSCKLGHANFDIYPEPYRAEVCTAEALREMRVRWDEARCNYTKHLMRTGEHYGATSKTYKLTQEKWAGIERQWRSRFDSAMSRAEAAGENVNTLRETSSGGIVRDLPSIHHARDEGKFPKLGDDEVVGPMEQVATLRPTKPPRRRATLFKFLQDVKFPSSTMMGRFSSQTPSR